MCKRAFRSELIIIQYAIQKLTDFYRNVLITAISISVSALEHFSVVTFFSHKKQDAQLSQRDRAAGYISFGQKWKTGTGRQYFTDIIGLSSTTVI